MDDIAAIRADIAERHVQCQQDHRNAKANEPHCGECNCQWPCDAARMAKADEAALAALEADHAV